MKIEIDMPIKKFLMRRKETYSVMRLLIIMKLSKEKFGLKIGSEVFINFKATDVKLL